MSRDFSRKTDESTLTTLCPRCLDAFRNARGIRVRRADPRQTIKEPCTYCQTRFGFDYYIQPTSPKTTYFKKGRWHCLSGQEPTDLDKKVMYWESKGKLVPTRDLIKTPEQIEGIRRAGVINTAVLDAVAAAIAARARAGVPYSRMAVICRDTAGYLGALRYEFRLQGIPALVLAPHVWPGKVRGGDQPVQGQEELRQAGGLRQAGRGP